MPKHVFELGMIEIYGFKPHPLLLPQVQRLRQEKEAHDRELSQQQQELMQQQEMLEKLKKEEQELRSSVEASRNELSRLQTNRHNMENNINMVRRERERE